jgi:hypothetical protein
MRRSASRRVERDDSQGVAVHATTGGQAWILVRVTTMGTE